MFIPYNLGGAPKWGGPSIIGRSLSIYTKDPLVNGRNTA